jgi:hypothetical protein
MSTLMNTAKRARFLTVQWNNVLTAALGLPMLAYGAVALWTSTLSDLAGFVGLVIIGAFY